MSTLAIESPFYWQAWYRYNEWGRAVWQLQHDKLKNAPSSLDWRFVAYMDPNEPFATEWTQTLAGQMVAVSWS